jgi:hypothetical protein
MRSLKSISIFLLFLAVNLSVQRALNAGDAEFSFDDASHYVSSSMIHDWLLSGQYSDPMGYAIAYHVRFPLVGIGLWGPAYYIVEAFWMILAGTGKASVLLLSAGMTAAICGIVASLAAKRANWVLGIAAGCAVAASGTVAPITSSLMLDTPIALASLLAALAYSAFLKEGRWQYSLLFGLLAVFALLIKGNAFSLGLFVVLAAALSGRWRLMLRPAFWIPAPIVLLVAGPWYLKTYPLLSQGFRYKLGLDYTRQALPANIGILAASLGIPIALLSLCGAWRVLRQRNDPLGACMLALTLSVLLFQSIAPAALEPRYMIPALPGLVLLAADGAMFLAGLARSGRALVLALCVAGMLLPPAWSLWSAAPRPKLGQIEASRAALAYVSQTNPVILVAADSPAENAAVSELAFADPRRPSLFVLRGSRLLGGGGYNRSDYRPLYNSVDQVRDILEQYQIPLIILTTSGASQEWAHVSQVEQVVAGDPAHWQRVWSGQGDLERNTSIYIRRDMSVASVDVGRLTSLAAPHRSVH